MQILLSKKDVKSAFKLVWVSPESSAIMCIELLGSHLGLDYDVAAVYLVLVFGWVGAPGQYMAWGW